ncbi:MAG: membrane integrity-associated transporter subunit PqiC [Thiohalobacterales bacterium]
MNNIYSLLLLVPVVLLAGCIGNPTRPSEFYVLSTHPATPVNSTLAKDAVSLGLGPLILPEIYDRPQIVTRSEHNRITLAEFNRWGGDLNKDLGRALADNLMSRLNTDRIVPYPWSRRYDPDFQVTVRLLRFDGVLGENASLVGIWRVLDANKGCELAADRFSFVAETDGPGYPALVSAMSRAVADLSQAMAEQIAIIEPGCPEHP